MSHVMFKYWELFVSFTQLLKCFKIENVSINPPQSKHPFTDDMLNFSVDAIIKATEDNKPNTVSGPDEIPVTLLKNCKKIQEELMHITWSHFLVTGEVTSFYKLSTRRIVEPNRLTTDLYHSPLMWLKYTRGWYIIERSITSYYVVSSTNLDLAGVALLNFSTMLTTF